MKINRHSTIVLFFMGLLASGLLVACNSTTTAQDSATAVSPTATVKDQIIAIEQEVADTTSRFLQSLQDDPTGASSLDDLSEPLRATVESDNLLTTLLGIDQIYRSFGVDTLEVDTNKGQAIVETGLNYVSPVKRDFVLTEEGGSWLINTIISYSMPAMSLPEDRLASAQVIIDYYQALEDKQINEAMALLAPSATENTEADVATAAKEIEGITTTSLQLIQASPDSEIFEATFWTLPDSEDPGDWTTGSNVRWIKLTHTTDGWRIAQISSEPMTTAVSTSPTADIPDGVIQQTTQALAQTLGIDSTNVTVVQANAISWPDSCLGMQTPDIMCAQHVVDGYQVTLAAGDQQYTYRSNGDGSNIAAEVALTWTREGGIAGFCNELLIDVTGSAIAYSCDGIAYSQVAQQLLNSKTRQQLYDWLNILKPFNLNQSDKAVIDGITITLIFNGQGDIVADDTIQSDIKAFAAQIYTQMTADQAAQTPTTDASCTLVANSDVTLYNRPDLGASQFGVMAAGDTAVISGQTANGWLGFEPAVAQAANVGLFRLRWLVPGSDVTTSGNCDTLTIYPVISPTACYEMAMADTPIYDQPTETTVTIATLPAGSYTAVIGKSDQSWYQVNLGDGSLADSQGGQIGWIAPEAGNFNGQSCANLPTVNP
jgi:hypothetical protein